MAPATRKKSSSARQRPSCYVLLTRRVTHKPPEPTTRRTRSQSAATTELDAEEEEVVKPVKAKATRKGKGKAKAAPKKPTPPTEDEARTPTPTPPAPSHPLTTQASSTRKPPPPPKHIHLGKPAISFEAARDISRLTTPDEGRSLLHPDPNAQSEPFVPLLLHDTDNPVLEEMTEPEMEMRGGEEGRWRIKGSSSRRMGSPPPVMPRDYPFADPSSARKSPPPRAHPHRIGKPPQPESSDGDGHTEPASSPTNTVKKKVSVTLGGARFERELELSTPVKHDKGQREVPPIPEPPSGGTPKIPPNFRRDDTASPQHHPHPPPSARPLSHRKLIAEASLRRRQQLAEERPVSPLPPSSEPSSAGTERVVQDTSVHNLSHDAFWPGDEELYAGSDPGDHYPSDEEDKENIVQVATSHRRTQSAVVDVLGVGRTVAAEESFETPQKPRRYNIRPPATLNTQDEATAALFAPDMSDESGVSNILDYASVAERRRAEEEERRRRRAFEFGVEEGAYVPVGEDADFMLPEPLSDDSIMGYDGYSPAQLSGSDKENAALDLDPAQEEEDPATPTARRTHHSHHEHGLPAPDTRGILQPRMHTSPARHPAGEDPFGILATEALLRARKAYSSGVKPKAKTSAAAAASIARASASKPVPAPSRVLARSASGRTLADPSPVRRVPFGQRSFQDLNPPTPGEDRDRFADLDLPPSSPPRAENELHSPARSQRSAATHDSIEDMYATPASERGDFALVLSTPVRAPRAESHVQAGSDNSIPAFPTSSPAVTPRKERRQEEVQRTPMTPRNGPRARGSVTMRRHKSHGGVGEEQEYDGRGEFEEREPSPSPVKQRPSNVYAQEMEEGEETETEMSKKITGTGGKRKGGKGKEREVPLIEPRTKGKENTGRARGRKRKSDEAGVGVEEDEDPELVTRRLEDMLPRPRVKAKKSTRPAAKKARRHLAEDSDDEEEDGEEVQRSSSLPGSPVKKPRKRGTTYGGARARQRRRGEESTPEEVREV